MTHRISLLLLTAVSALSVAACQGGEEKTSIDAVSEPSPVSETKTEKTSAATPTVSASPECSVGDPKDWKASVNAQPPERPRLSVSGVVVVPTSGYKVELQRLGTDFNPTIVTLDLTVTPPGAGTIVSPVVSPIKASITVPDVQRVMKKVTVKCGKAIVVEITNIPTYD